MENQNLWTTRGSMGSCDRLLISELMKKGGLLTARIFITGEVHEEYIGEEAVKLLININDTLYTNGAKQEPLFVETIQNTIRMTRFDPIFVWQLFKPDNLVICLSDEINRLGINMEPLSLDYFDFYKSMIEYLKTEKGEYSIPFIYNSNDFNQYLNALYLTCLILYDKTGLFDISVHTHFSNPINAEYLRNFEYREITNFEHSEVLRLRKEYSHIKSLTNPEINFAINLLDKSKFIHCYNY